MRFLDKTVIVTGAASGIGAAATALFAGEGATVFASDIDVAGGEKLARETPGDVRFVECDVCDPAAIKALMDHAAQETGGIDTLFNNAGAGGARESIAEIEPEAWDRTMDLLLRSVAMGIRYAIPHMKGRKGASIVNVSSVAAVGPGYSPTTYAVAKAGVLHLTKCAATDLAQFGIRVNAVQPGVDDRDSVATMLGQPTLTGEFNSPEWYYWGRNTNSLAFTRPDPTSQTVVRIRFDKNGTVAAVDKMGMEQVAQINPTDEKTPTLGRKRGFFQQLFGNIGTVGGVGAGGAACGCTTLSSITCSRAQSLPSAAGSAPDPSSPTPSRRSLNPSRSSPRST